MNPLKWISDRFYSAITGLPPYPMGYMMVYATKDQPCAFCKRLPQTWETGFAIVHGQVVCDVCGEDMFWWDEEPRWYEGLTPEQIDLCIVRPMDNQR